MTINEIKDIFSNNDRLIKIYSLYLNEYPDMINEKLVCEIKNECGADDRTAFVALLSEMVGLDSLENEDDEKFETEYLSPSVTHLKASDYLNDPYLKNISIPKKILGNWELTSISYEPYEGFIWNDTKTKHSFKDIPQLGFFSERFSFPAVLENGREWMAIKPNEIETMKDPIAKAKGTVVTLGLGMGYFAYMVSNKPEVTSVTVVERDKNVIDLFESVILPQFPFKNKIKIVNCDAFEYLDSLTVLSGVNYLFADIWHDVGDGTPLYILIKEYENRLKNINFEYWIEKSIISHLKNVIFADAVYHYSDSAVEILGKKIYNVDELQALASDDGIKSLIKAKKIDL